jgi:16S rRNA (cytosine1402-N4)-methyltransferase
MSRVSDFSHQPVLLDEVLECLAIKPHGIYVDCTLGGGGHAAAILDRLTDGGLLLGLDQDDDALAAAGKRLSGQSAGAGLRLIRSNFTELASVLADNQISGVDGILADLGVSSWQLDEAERGFAYNQDGPLDMRMDRRRSLTAARLVNTASESELTRILREYGEERYASRISRAIVARRTREPFMTTRDLADLIRSAMPAAARQEAQHPAKRSFQALRIAVNGELDALTSLLAEAPQHLIAGGRLCIITFHSLEDRLVKDAFRTLMNPCICPRDLPVCACGRVSQGSVITRRPIMAGSAEQTENPRARSARLRCFEKAADR